MNAIGRPAGAGLGGARHPSRFAHLSSGSEFLVREARWAIRLTCLSRLAAFQFRLSWGERMELGRSAERWWLAAAAPARAGFFSYGVIANPRH